MNNGSRSAVSQLENIRKSRGVKPCVDQFHEMAVKNRPLAVQSVNSPGVSFATFYILLPDIRGFKIAEELNGRSRVAERLCELILSGKKAGSNGPHPVYDDTVHEALRWMFLTGVPDDGLEDDFDRILDICASVLTKKYHDPEILPALVKLIFQRNRKGSYLHDLTWAFFQSRNPRVLRLAAEFLNSANDKDVRLAHALLHLPEANGTARGKRAQYQSFENWLKENSAYLHFTGESFNLTNQPNACSIDLGAKYLCHEISSENREPRPSLTELEQSLLADFVKVREDEKELLARFSQNTYANNAYRWNRWIHYPLEKQLQIARSGRRGNL